MDLSKLPKMSHTPSPPPAPEAGETPAPATRHAAPAEPGPGFSPEGIIDIVIGLVLIFISWQVFDYLIHLITGRPFNYPVTDAAGNPLPYPGTIFFWVNLGTAIFGVCLLAYGVLVGRATGVIGWVFLGLFTFSAVVNVGALLYAMKIAGPQIMTILAAGFSAYLAMIQWNRLKGRMGA